MKNLYNKFSYYLLILSMLFILSSYMVYNNSLIVYLEFYMFSIGNYPLYYTLILDWMSLLFMTFVMFISFSVFMYSKYYMEGETNYKRFLYLVLLFVFSMMMMVLSPNLVSILLGWDGLGLVSYCLVIFYQNSTSYKAGMITILSNRIGDFGLIMGIIMMIFMTWNMEFIDHLSILCMCMVFLASFTKSAQFPFSAWLPAAMSAPTPVSALVHSSTLVTAGVYLMIRFHNSMNQSMNIYMMIVSLLTILLSGLCALNEFDMKKIVAMSTLSQLGFMMFIMSLGCWKIVYFHMLTHAIFKSMLFLSVGSVLHSGLGNQDMRFMGGMGITMYSSGAGMLISSMCLMGIPFMSGFYSKEMIIQNFFMHNTNLMLQMFFMIGVILTIMYSIRMIYLSLIIMYNSNKMININENIESFMPIMILSSLSIIMGSLLEWFIFDEISLEISSLYLMNILLVLLLIFSLFSMLYMKIMPNNTKYWFVNKSSYNMLYLTYFGNKVFGNIMMYKQMEMTENKWGELMGAVGINKLLLYGIYSTFVQLMDMKKIFIIFMIMMVLFI